MSNSSYIISIFSSWFLISLLQACATELPIESEVNNTIPNTEIYLAEISFPENKLTIGKAINITQNPGYDNQPYFLPGNNSLLYTSVKNLEDEKPQSDIYAYSLKSASTTQITATPESEYSPTLTPSGEFISVVRVDSDGEESSQCR